MDEQSCGSCGKCTPHEDYDNIGVCAVTRERTPFGRGKNCTAYRPRGQETVRAEAWAIVNSEGTYLIEGWGDASSPAKRDDVETVMSEGSDWDFDADDHIVRVMIDLPLPELTTVEGQATP